MMMMNIPEPLEDSARMAWTSPSSMLKLLRTCQRPICKYHLLTGGENEVNCPLGWNPCPVTLATSFFGLLPSLWFCFGFIYNRRLFIFNFIPVVAFLFFWGKSLYTSLFFAKEYVKDDTIDNNWLATDDEFVSRNGPSAPAPSVSSDPVMWVKRIIFQMKQKSYTHMHTRTHTRT